MIFSEVAMTVYLLPQPLEHSCGKLKWLNKKRSRHSFLTVFILLFGLSNQIFMFQCSTLHKCSWTFSSVFFYDLPQRAFVQNVWGTLSHNGRKNRTDSSVLVWNGTARVLPIFQEICLCPSIPSAKISLLFSEISAVNWPAFNSNQSFSICSRSKVVISYPTKMKLRFELLEACSNCSVLMWSSFSNKRCWCGKTRDWRRARQWRYPIMPCVAA